MKEPQEIDILLVEDNPNDAELTLRALRKNELGARLAIVRDGAEAIDYLFGEKPRPKVVFLDLKLPKVDGIEVLRKIKTDPRTKNTPVVMLTSSQEERDVMESYRLGVNSYIVKPVDFSNFVHAVSELGMYWGILNKVPY